MKPNQAAFDLFSMPAAAVAGVTAGSLIPAAAAAAGQELKPLQARAVLVRLKFAMPRRARHDDNAAAGLAADAGASEDSVAVLRKFYPAHKTSVSMDAWGMFEDVIKAQSALRTYYYKVTAPWSDKGMRILPTALFMEFTAELRRLQGEFTAAADVLASNYDALIDRCRAARNGMFDRDDYPATAAEFRKGMKITAAWLPVPDESHIVADMLGDAVADVAASVREQTQEAVSRTAADCFAKLAEPIARMAETLKDADKTFRDSLIGNLRDVLAVLPALNLSGDAKLAGFIDEAKVKLASYDPDALRHRPSVREQAAKDAASILDRMKDYLPAA